jgi:hypothetical protein
LDVVKYLIEHGADVNMEGVPFLGFDHGGIDIIVEDNNCDTGFTLAARDGHLYVVKYSFLRAPLRVAHNRLQKTGACPWVGRSLRLLRFLITRLKHIVRCQMWVWNEL